MTYDDRDDTTAPGGGLLTLCRQTCPDEPTWTCRLQAGHGPRHETDSGDWWADPPVDSATLRTLFAELRRGLAPHLKPGTSTTAGEAWLAYAEQLVRAALVARLQRASRAGLDSRAKGQDPHMVELVTLEVELRLFGNLGREGSL